MTDNFNDGDAILYMKVGTHAGEGLTEIIARKRKEIADAGFSMWGYGGNTLHPRTMVQPFVASHTTGGRVIRLVMQPMNSHHFAAKVRAEEYSADGINWTEVPEAINVVGSRYALCIRDLREVEMTLRLDNTQVAVGLSKGRKGSDYVKGHVDKACLEVTGDEESGLQTEIGLVADIVDPFAVFLRN